MEYIIAIIGVGYVGLQNAIAISKLGLEVVAFDKNTNRINELKNGVDKNYESSLFACPNLKFTDNLEDLKKANYFLISVPTPINDHFVPDVFPLKQAANLVGSILKKNDVVILESTVYPGATRELLIPILEEETGMKSGTDFFIGYSSERIVPGDSSHNLSNMYKVISGQNDIALQKVKSLYAQVYDTKLFCASCLEVAEASKLLENIQRDVNIALMNEFAQVLEKIGVSFTEVHEAASTKWNFLPFKPGLVGGHCIPEDPYYLIYQASKFGSTTNLISEARKVNEQFVRFIVEMTVKLIIKQNVALRSGRIIILGVSFKPNVSDTRHSLSVTLYKRLTDMGFEVLVCDPIANRSHLDLPWVDLNMIQNSPALILVQPHDEFLAISPEQYSAMLHQHGVFIDIPGAFIKKQNFKNGISYWSL